MIRALELFEDLALQFFVFALIVLVVNLIALWVRHGIRTNPCFFSHAHRYIAIVDINFCMHAVPWSHNGSHLQLVRWVCERCPSMGESCVSYEGVVKIEHGKLVPDEKRWATWKDNGPRI